MYTKQQIGQNSKTNIVLMKNVGSLTEKNLRHKNLLKDSWDWQKRSLRVPLS